MTSYGSFANPYSPQEIRDGSTGLRPSHEQLLQLIDADNPVWPAAAAILREMADAGVEVNEQTYGIAVKLATHRAAIIESRRQHDRRITYVSVPLTAMGSIVYYIRRGDLIKIGTTADPARRFAALLPEEILAFEPGGRDEETFRHRQFDHLRGRGENFRQAPELMHHIKSMRKMHGAPDPAWSTVANHRKAQKSAAAPDPADGDVLPASEICARLGVKDGTLRSWVRHGRIKVAGRNDRGIQVFPVDRATALRDSLVARQARHARRTSAAA